MSKSQRPTIYLGSSKKDLNKLDPEVREVFVHGLYEASIGETPHIAKVLNGFGGASVLELIEDYKTDTYRAIYTVKFREAIYVLHVFKKKSKKGGKLPPKDKELIESRLKWAKQDYQQRFK